MIQNKMLGIIKNKNIIEFNNIEGKKSFTMASNNILRSDYKMEMAEIVMNPVRQRIFQYFLLHETGTVKEIRKALPDIPSASLYRHVKILVDSSILMVVGENRIRGTVESIYQLNKDALTVEDENGNAVQMSLLSLCASFAKYFSDGNANPKKDMLLFTNCTLVLTDEEFSGFLSEINEVALKYMKVKATTNSKTRQITLISAPTDGQVI